MRIFLAIILSCSAAFGQAFTAADVAWIGNARPTSAAAQPLVLNNLATNVYTTDANTYTTVSFTPTANALVLAMVNNTKGTAADAPTLAGNGLTWVEITNKSYSSDLSRLTIFRAMGSSPTTGTLVASFGGATQNGAIIRVLEFQNADTSGVNGAGAIVQSNATFSADSADPSITLAALNSNGKNAVIAFSINGFNPYAGAAEAGWTENYDSGHALPTAGGYICYQLLSTDNTVTITRTTTGWALIALEIKAQ